MQLTLALIEHRAGPNKPGVELYDPLAANPVHAALACHLGHSIECAEVERVDYGSIADVGQDRLHDGALRFGEGQFEVTISPCCAAVDVFFFEIRLTESFEHFPARRAQP